MFQTQGPKSPITNLSRLKKIKLISSGETHSAAVSGTFITTLTLTDTPTESGELYTWGDASFGKLGGSDQKTWKVKLSKKVIAVTAGSNHTLILTE